ncbi:MAG: hypothetical protein HC914_03125 [Chloroflexaceae bacterium]|nr:hypothetical protein [Chloroflexaceae bacterium]
MAVHYARPRLITSDDRHYRQYVEQYLIQRQNNRAMRPPRQRDIFGGQVEAALRDWLGTRYQLAETRILGYEEVRGRRSNTKYRELDAVVIEDRRTIRVFEIKASRTAASLRRATDQLRETRAILKLLYPVVHSAILLVDTGIPDAARVAEIMAAEDAPAVPPETLPAVLEALENVRLISNPDDMGTDGATIDVMLFSVDTIIDMVGAEHLALDWEADDEIDTTPPTPPEPSLAYSTDEAPEADDSAATADDDNPLAAALRKAGLSGK